MDFTDNEAEATTDYRKMWVRGKAESKLTLKDSQEIYLTVAGELISRDVLNYDEYKSYIIRSLKSEDSEILSAAISALNDVQGFEVIDILFKFAEDDDLLVKVSALTVIQNKSAYYGPQQDETGEQAHLIAKLKRFCARDSSKVSKRFCTQIR